MRGFFAALRMTNKKDKGKYGDSGCARMTTVGDAQDDELQQTAAGPSTHPPTMKPRAASLRMTNNKNND